MPRRKATGINEADSINYLITQARKLGTAAHTDYKADWLVSGSIGSKLWEIIDEQRNNEIIKLKFDAPMPDGSLLTDPQNQKLLFPLQKIAFHLRMGSLTGDLKTARQWIIAVEAIINFSRWLVLHGSVFAPQKHGFRLITEDHLVGYFEEFASGGIINTLKLKERFIATAHENIESDIPLKELLRDPYHLDKKFISDTFLWLSRKNGIVHSKRRKLLIISRRHLHQILGCSYPVLDRYSSMGVFLDQFDRPANRANTGYTTAPPPVPRRSPKSKDETITRQTMRMHKRQLKILFSAHSLIPDEIPHIANSAFEKTSTSKLRLDGHTRLIPIEVGLNAIQKASEMVVVYGPTIVQAVLHYARNYTAIREIRSLTFLTKRMNELFENTRQKWLTPDTPNIPSQSLCERFNVVSLTSNVRNHNIDKGISFKILHEAFYGACALLIGMCKPIRDGEIHKLKRNCLISEFEGGGALLIQELEKSGMMGARQTITRPIPSVAARAIQLLQVMGSELSKIYADKSGPIRDYLFYIPDHYLKAPTGKALSYTLNKSIDTFCALHNLPNDENGTPWVIRIHEMRKFFLLIMYKHHDNKLRSILSYAAGHTNLEDLDAYISFSHDDPESVRYESECIADKLLSLENGVLLKSGNNGLCALYSYICEHFDVSEISALSKDKFYHFLGAMQRSDIYKSTVYTLEIKDSDGSLTTLDFAVRFNGEIDERYN
ncbi:hypothetical protein SAMN04490202_0811 [Pseudomonas reinekei]|uniref:Integrase n=1 Tax=Pseudomonas reinekei TaxID=395598 RepID=A0A1H0JCZ0_PSERE|nr:hypothetical protein [Pseudomonas reinekei]KAB0483809.1 hypothetical protein F7R15_19335 [Pseudomonas reinekei]OLU00872.1 hypothetical protein BVK86_20290 [Pseudomonas reinekei]SDO41393.1 hypothetical protein SAMN04490202_0811 [Pseudomonas reinekei]